MGCQMVGVRGIKWMVLSGGVEWRVLGVSNGWC